MPNEVFIIRTASFLPNDPVSNDEMEKYLGLINERASRSKTLVLRRNGIKNRHYALSKNGIATHTNAQMAALAIRNLFKGDPAEMKTVELLACGTSSPDQFLPSHTAMVHGWLPDSNPIEVVSPSGACCSGVHAVKYAYLAIKAGEVKKAVTAGSERTSALLRADIYELEAQKLAALEKDPYIAFEKDFLRWMLSDGAGAFLLSNEKNKNEISLRIEWLEMNSFANQKETCMYSAGDKLSDGSLKSYMDFSAKEIAEKSVMSMKQDLKLLSENIIPLGFEHLKSIFKKRNLSADQIDYFLPHMSSEFFRKQISDYLTKNDTPIPQEKWFTNLSTVGNVGAASIYMMIDELMRSGRLKRGEKILIAVPESARFSYVFGLFTVV